MNKTELITVVAQKTDLSKRDAERVVKTVFPPDFIAKVEIKMAQRFHRFIGRIRKAR